MALIKSASPPFRASGTADPRRIDLDLAQLRGSVAPLFAAYDAEVERGDRDRAHAVKMRITRAGIQALEEAVPADARGLYFFADEDDRLASLTYIGMASPGSLRRRIEKRLRDETCLDARQYGRSREEVWDTAYRRMCVSMGSDPRLLLGYAYDHVKTTALFKQAGRLIFFVTDAPAPAVKAAESLLIYSAISAGAPLLNIQERDALTTSFEAGEQLAMKVIELAGIEVEHWSGRAMTLLSRFDGKCC
jgi:hypothetical protein